MRYLIGFLLAFLSSVVTAPDRQPLGPMPEAEPQFVYGNWRNTSPPVDINIGYDAEGAIRLESKSYGWSGYAYMHYDYLMVTFDEPHGIYVGKYWLTKEGDLTGWYCQRRALLPCGGDPASRITTTWKRKR